MRKPGYPLNFYIKPMTLIKIGLRSLKPAEKINRAGRIAKGLKSTPVFSSEKELITEIENSKEALKKAIELAAYGDKRALEHRRNCERQMDDVLRKAAAFVNHTSHGKPELIESAGFDLRKRNNKPEKLSNPQELKIKRTDKSGELILSWKPVKNSRNYLIQTRTKKPEKDSTWETRAFSTRSRCTLDELKPGKTYWIRTLAVGAKGVSKPSNIVEIMAA